MGDLFGLLHDLGERIANNKGESSTNTNGNGNSNSNSCTQVEEEDPVEARFRSVLPSLLHTYFLPSKVKEREVTAILKLLCHTIKHYPGVFYHGKACAVLPILGRILPFLAEPTISARHGIMCETAGALLSLLKTGDREIYRLVFVGAMLLIEDLSSVASFSLNNHSQNTVVSIECFTAAYSKLVTNGKGAVLSNFCEIPSCWKLDSSPGLLIDVTGDLRWRLLAEGVLKLSSRFLTEAALHVEGLVTLQFMTAVGKLLCYGDASLERTCFDFFRVAIPIVDIETVPCEKIILSIVFIVSLHDEESMQRRNSGYDSAMGTCLSTLMASCPRETLECTAQAFLDILPDAIFSAQSFELKAALCTGVEYIVRRCRLCNWRIESMLELIFVPELASCLYSCLGSMLDVIGFETFAKDGTVTPLLNTHPLTGISISSTSKTKEEGSSNSPQAKRYKIDKMESNDCNRYLPPHSVAILGDLDMAEEMGSRSKEAINSVALLEQDEKTCQLNNIHNKLLLIISKLNPGVHFSSLNTEGLLSAFQVLAKLFENHPKTSCNQNLLKHMISCLPWLSCKREEFTISHLSSLLEALLSLLSCSDNRAQLCQDSSTIAGIFDILQLPWIKTYENHPPKDIQRVKLQAVGIGCKLTSRSEGFFMDKLLTLALEDKDASVQAKAVSHFPVVIDSCSPSKKVEHLKRIENLASAEAAEVRTAVASIVGQVACSGRQVLDDSYLVAKGRKDSHVDMKLSQDMYKGVACPMCDTCESLDKLGKMEGAGIANQMVSINWWLAMFSRLLFEESSEQVQVAFIRIMPAILVHASHDDLFAIKENLLKCLDTLPVHNLRAIREAFCSQIKFFFNRKVLLALFGDNSAIGGVNRELEVLGKLQHALVGSIDPNVLETLLDTVSEIVQIASSSHRQLFFFAIVLILEQLDSRYMTVQVTSIKLLKRYVSVGSPCEETTTRVKLTIDSVWDELYEYLCARLITRPVMIKEFSAAVLELDTVDLVKRMVPVVLPKLVIQQEHDNEALTLLHELARLLKTELPLLLLEWCHKVLSVLLLKADGTGLKSALHFYEAQTGFETHEILAAVLPALLDELIWFLGDSEDEAAARRSARVAPMIQEVANIITRSDDLSGFLRDHFVGLLNSIDQKMLQNKDLASQKQAVRCIEKLIEMIGDYINAFVPKIMALLTRALQTALLQSEGLRVWLLFVRRLAEVAPQNLKGVAAQVVVALMPCLDGHQDDHSAEFLAAVEVLEELVIKNRNALDEQAGELPLLPSLPALEGVNTALHKARGSTSLHDQLKRASDGLSHESVSVRFMTSRELKRLIKERRKDIVAMVVGDTSSDMNVLNNLIACLLRGCAEELRTPAGQRFKLTCAECLGEVGAIDPSKVPINLRHRSKIERTDDDLVFELIQKHLARVLRAALFTDVQDAAALAIQELLKLCGCRRAALVTRTKASASHIYKSKSSLQAEENTSNQGSNECPSSDAISLIEKGEKLWSRFSDDVKEIITPCLTSKYCLKNANAEMPSGPIFRPGMSFRRWMYLWVRRLVSQSTGSREDIFNACKGIVRHDMGTALYVLPYLVLNIVCNGSSEARASVKDEILSVLAEAVSVTGESPPSSDKSEKGCSGIRNGSTTPSEISIQAVFTLVDNLGQWLDECKQDISLSQAVQTSTGQSKSRRVSPTPQVNKNISELILQCDRVQELLAAIPKTALAGASFRCQAYARALLYFESHVREKSGTLNPAAGINGTFADEDVSLLLEIYSGLDEPDGLSGLSCLRKSMSLEDQVLINEKAGNWAEALTCYEHILQLESESIPRHFGVLDCLLNMGHFQAMITHVDGLNSRFPDYRKEWSMRGVQAAWRLGKWDLLNEYLCGGASEALISGSADNNGTFDMSLGKLLLAHQKRDESLFAELLMHSRQLLLVPLAAAGMESYTRAYPFIVKLQMLQELEDFIWQDPETGFGGEPFKTMSESDMLNIVEDWEDRLRVTQPSLWTREPILALRRLLLKASNMEAEVGACWLQYAKLCRAAGHYETSNRAILEAQSFGAPNAHMELAKLLWDTKKSHQAISVLQQALSKAPIELLGSAAKAALGGLLRVPSSSVENPSTLLTQSRREEHADVAKTLLLLARWVHCTGQKQKEDVICLYSRVRELQPKWEKSYFFFAKYCDDILTDARRRQEEGQENTSDKGSSGKKRQGQQAVGNIGTADDKPWWTYLPDVILHYAKGLHKGHRHLYQALPRLLTLWFEFGSTYRSDTSSANPSIKTVHQRVMGIMRGCLKDLPTYQWLTVFSQLVSRICHQNEEIVRLVRTIICTVLQNYPHQALWMMAAVFKSTVNARRQAAAEILQSVKNSMHQEHEKNLFIQFTSLTEQLIRLCFHGGSSKARTLSLSTEFGHLKRMMPVEVILPVQRALTVNLPTDTSVNSNYNPFSAGDHVTISSIADEVEILASLQRPKKVVLHGSDGSEHPFLCKPKDDLRKDSRMMEFTTMINRLLSKDPTSRRRKLYIRTFAVIPLTEDCGMVEWVLHTRGLRHILQDLYVSIGKFDRQKTNPTVKAIYDQNQSQMSEAEMFRTKVLPMFPPIFHQWFLNTFTEPATWFQARIAYAHTTAVWSMVGHIVGLGDRHGENILFDSTTGDCVHVDFSCLFDKGLQLEKPELVPFRLTQNIVDGLGITGYEGIFLRVCEITLSVLRTNRETLMSVLETFIHDPLVEWTKSHKSSGVEVQNPQAQRAMSNIEARLQGVVVGVGAAPSLPLSVEGQVHRLIAEAVSHENLGKMYIWWMPWF